LSKKINLLGYSLESLERFFSEIDESMFRARQLMNWVHQKGVLDFNLMTNFNKNLREKLKDIAIIEPPKIIEEHISDEGTIKYLVEIESGSMVEMVIIPEKNRRTLCVSSQAGCALQCTFCATGAQGFDQDLKSSEIIGQLWLANFNAKNSEPITNIVFMGMGEPLLNYNNLIKGITKITNKEGLGISPRRITVSTSGISKMIKKMADDNVKFNLAISLHSAIEKTRNKIMPFTKNFPLEELKEAIKYWYSKTKKMVTYEYIVWNSINDDDEHINALVKFCKSSPSKVNLIEYNSINSSFFVSASSHVVNKYVNTLENNKIPVTIRKSRGKDIDAACGQLANKLK